MNREDSAAVMKLLYRLERSGRTDSTCWTAMTLQAELQLLADNFERNRLTVRRIKERFPDRHDGLLQLNMQSLLHQRQPTEALKLSESIHPLSAALPSHSVAVLRLESLLQLRMLAGQLQDAELIKKTDRRFDQAAEQSLAWMPSVRQDAAQSIISTYQLVRTVGSEAADLIGHVETLQARGQQDDAIRELQRALRLLRPDSSLRSRGAIYLAIGELHLSRESWHNAIESLRLATEHFIQANLPELASRADLLHAFCIGQQWRKSPADAEFHAAYVNALTQHRIQWNEQHSWETATDWLIQVTQPTDPLLACEMLQQVVQRATAAAKKVDALLRWGVLLDTRRYDCIASKSKRSRPELTDAFVTACEDMRRNTDDLTDEAAALRLAEISVMVNATTDWEEWTSITGELPIIRRQLHSPDKLTQSRFNELQLVAASRTSTALNTLDQIQTAFSQQHATAPLNAAQRLNRFLTKNGLILPGDSFIAGTIEDLIEQQLEMNSTPSQLLTMFSLTGSTARITRNLNLNEQLLELILEKNLTSAQANTLANTLLQSHMTTDPDSTKALMQLWQRVRTQSPEGSDMWLEACLQLAQMRTAKGQRTHATQQLRITSVLYPQWGSAERLHRVTQLLTRLQSNSESD